MKWANTANARAGKGLNLPARPTGQAVFALLITLRCWLHERTVWVLFYWPGLSWREFQRRLFYTRAAECDRITRKLHWQLKQLGDKDR